MTDRRSDGRNCRSYYSTLHCKQCGRAVKTVCLTSNSTRLIQMCPTRWIDRHDSVIVFVELLKAVIDCLEVISEWPDRDSSAGANQLLNSVKSSQSF